MGVKLSHGMFYGALAFAWLVFSPFFAAAAEWTGDGDGSDWFDGNNWDPVGVPGAAAEVTVGAGADIILANETAELTSFIMTGGTLTFSNWTTRLRADTVVLNEGNLTLPPAFTNTVMSNRVWIVCSDFTLGGDALIDADGRGYMSDSGEGAGKQDSGFAGGAGHGGRGGRSDRPGAYNGDEHGSLEEPVLPGSGGARSNIVGAEGGSGGGAVLIDATGGSVLINGTISANGADSPYRGGGGSGGSIFILCSVFGGDGGVLRANGGAPEASGRGSGGGGRIALHYSAISGTPGVSFLTQPGGNEHFDTINQWWLTADMGTLYLSDSSLLSEDLTDGRFNGVRLFMDGVTSWSVNNLAVSNTWLHFAEDGFELEVANDLTIGASGNLGVGKYSGVSPAFLNCGGNIIVTNGGALHVYSGETNDVLDYGALVSVTNDIRVYADSWIYPYSHATNGGSVLFRMRNMDIRTDVVTNAGINAFGRGYLYGQGSGKGGQGGSRGGGGGYGGGGGWGPTTGALGGETYGCPVEPLEPGSGSGVYFGTGGIGGGLVRLDAADRVLVDGRIIADGGIAFWHSGGGSGGGVYIKTLSLEGAGKITADGGDGSSLSGGGGGGRIAIDTTSDSLTRQPAGTYIEYAGAPNGSISVAGAAIGYEPGTNGTFYLRKLRGTVFTFF